MNIPEFLNGILRYSEQPDPNLREVLQPGYSAEQIRQLVSFDFPPEILELYSWHNGMQDTDGMEQHQLFYYHHFLSLEDAYRTYQELMAINQEIEAEGYRPQLFPLFSFMGEWYMVHTDREDPAYGSIWFVHMGDGQVYDSLRTMLGAIHECYVVGAYTVHGNEIEINQQLVAAIKAKWNECRQLDDGTTLNYHP